MAVSQVTPLSTIDSAAVIQNFSRELRRRSIARDIYTNLRAKTILYNDGDRPSIPNGIYGTISAKDSSGANNITVSFKPPIQGNILRGTTVALGTEVAPQMKSGSLYRANYRFVIQDEPGYGESKLDAAPYNLYQEHVNDLGPHASAEEGLEIRMAYVETYGWNLMAGSTAAFCAAQWNRNFFVAGLRIDQQPVFHPNYNTYTQRIIDAVDTVSGGHGNFPQSAAQCLNCTVLDQLGIYGQRRHLMPLDGRRQFYLLTISDVQAVRFQDPQFVNTMGNRWVQVAQIRDEEVQNWYGLLGVYKSAAGFDIFVCVDERLPTLLFTGTAVVGPATTMR
jgi:hypothetical protein